MIYQQKNQPVNKPPVQKATRAGSDLDAKGRRRTLAPTALAQYLGQDSCDRFLRFYLYKGETEALRKRLETVGLPLQRALQPFGPLMAKLGDRVESGVVAQLGQMGYKVSDLKDRDETATVGALRAARQPVYLYQAAVRETIGQWTFEGQVDLIRAERDTENGQLRLLVGDVKSTRKDKVQHRLQVAIYVRLLDKMLKAAGENPLFEGAVIRRDTDGALQNPESVLPFDLQPYFAAIDRLIEALDRVDSADADDLHYYIDHKCDGCLFNPICLVESAERQDLALVPFVESTDKRTLAAHGIRTIKDLAGLKVLPARPENGGTPPDREIKTAPGKETLVNTIAERWQTGAKLDRLVQRAARVHAYLNPQAGTNQYGYFFDSARSILPDDKETYPDLIKIFLDVQTDYMEDRVYLAGARLVSPKGIESVVRITPGVPNLESERALLTEWVTEIFQAVYKLAQDPQNAFVHLYLYNRHDQRHLLEALRRHLDVFAALPALYQLLTETPAMTQRAVSFVYDEAKERSNLTWAGYTLQAVSFQLGFRWFEGENQLYYRKFERGVFDYLVQRKSDNLRIMSAARFFSTIPLEYAYGAWGMFKAMEFKPQQRRDVEPYLNVTVDDLVNFQAKRLEALAYIEGQYRFKNKYIKKEPLNLIALGALAAQTPPFRQILEEFLYIEHYANLQEHLELFEQPIIKRMQAGRALLLRCTGVEERLFRNKKSYVAHFTIDFSGTGLEPEAALQLSKLKQNDWCILNPLQSEGRAWDILRGRLGIIRRQEGFELSLDLSDMTLTKTKDGSKPVFRYFHEKVMPTPGEFYTLDEMVDDLNGDKLLDACRNADTNPFYHLMSQAANENNSRPNLNTELADKARDFLSVIETVENPFAPTRQQRTVIAGHFSRKILLVQGPPGTGKSHTLGWAVLCRMFAERAANGGTLRVAVSCQTHNAVNIVLQSIAGKLAKLQGTPAANMLQDLRLYKIGDDDEKIPDCAMPLDPWALRRELTNILGSQLAVIGGTPGGLHKLMKQATSNAPETFWTQKPFDLVILDEASQMNLPQAILATSWLRPDGQLLVVGDHRQMAPILAHAWAAQPYRSVFQYLLDLNFPKVALDESFRLHAAQAEFLHHNIYRQDGINFHSRRQALLPDCTSPDLHPYLNAVMNPAYPVIVVQHAEQVSQQANPTEANLIAPLVSACFDKLGLDGADGVGVVVPHRAQKALLRARFPQLAAGDAVDTVERYQGGERDVIIVSATASDPDYVLAEAEFLLNPNRLNVALSRPRKKLVVIASQSVFNFLSAQLEIFEQNCCTPGITRAWR
jgi:hypothetical protein